MSHIPQRCIIKTGLSLTKPEEEALVAVNEPDGWIVIPGSKVPEGRRSFRVTEIESLPAPRVAVLDDQADIPDGIAALFSRQGIQVAIFNDIESLLEVVRIQPFDAYILNWSNETNATSKSAIEYIRDIQKSDATIVVLSGQLRIDKAVVADIAHMVERHKVSVLEKPPILEILGKTFYNILFQIPSGRSDDHL